MLKTVTVLALGLAPLATAAAQSENVEIYRVFGPEFPGLYKHPASITQLDNGDLYLAYYGGSGEYGDDTAVYGARQKKGDPRGPTPSSSPTRPTAAKATPWSGKARTASSGCFMSTVTAKPGATRA